jgi:cyanophycinase-like exopeptidase
VGTVSSGASARLLAIMGSGETSPTMTATHRELFSRLGEQVPAVLLETPYAFQENKAEISAKAKQYFGDSVRRQVEILPDLHADADALAVETALARLRAARWAFAGPGSPSYALDRWRGTQVASALAELLQRGGCAVFASAAACTIGTHTLPVYEIYKCGQPPSWLEGLHLVAAAGLRVAVIPHFDNTEGGTHDTRYCYLGERRLRQLEDQLADDTAILGVDEHTAAVLDLDAQLLTVSGRGGVTLRRRGHEWTWTSGATVDLDELRHLAAGSDAAGGRQAQPAAACPTAEAGAGPLAKEEPVPLLPQVVDRSAAAFDRALEQRDAAGMVAAILDIDHAIVAWSTDTLQSDDVDRAHSMLRSLVVRLGEAAATGLRDPRKALALIVEPLVGLRASLRQDDRYDLADAVRDALAAADIELHDRPDATIWSLRDSHPERQP